MIKIFSPNSYNKERNYIYNVVFKEWLGINYSSFNHEYPYTLITSNEINSDKEIIIDDILFSISKKNWLTKTSLPELPLHHLDLSEYSFIRDSFNSKIPLIYGTKESRITSSPNKVEIKFDLLGSIFFMITRYEEIVKQSYDSHERFYSKASLCHNENFLHRPIVNEYLDILWQCLLILWPDIKRKKRTYNLFLTHDVDHPSAFDNRPLSTLLKTTAGDLLKRKDIQLFSKRVGALFLSKMGKDQYDPFNTFEFIMNESENNNIKSAFFFIAGHTAGLIDGYYDLDMPKIRQLMRKIHERGHEIGLHPSYNTFLSKANLKNEFDNLRRVAEIENIQQDRWGGRQHYLRWKAPETWQIWDDVGLNYDSTLSFADHIGFRCGVCYDFPVFNLLTSTQLKLREIPLIVMEGSLLGEQYQCKQLNEVYTSIVDISNTIRHFSGILTLLWHNNMLITTDKKNIYKSIIKSIA
jgi:hypothetical protein